MASKPAIPPNLALLVSIIAISTASIMIRLADSPPLAIAAWRLCLSSLMLIPFFLLNRGVSKLRGITRRELLTLMGVGAILAIHFASWITSLGFTSIASSVIFVHIDPIFVAVVSHFVLGEKLSSRSVTGIIIAFIGASTIAFGDIGLSKENIFGDLLSLIGAIALGIYILAGRRIRQSLDLTTYVTPVYIFSALFLVMAAILTGTPLTGYSPETLKIFSLIALVPMIFGHTLYNWTLRWLSAPIVSISLLGEPIGASILAYFILGEMPGAYTVIGGAITLIGIFICLYSNNKKV